MKTHVTAVVEGVARAAASSGMRVPVLGRVAFAAAVELSEAAFQRSAPQALSHWIRVALSAL